MNKKASIKIKLVNPQLIKAFFFNLSNYAQGAYLRPYNSLCKL